MADALTKEKREELREAFYMFDKDGDGRITASELGVVLKSMGHTPTDTELRDLIHEVDADGNGTIEFNEFLVMMSKRLSSDLEKQEYVDAFKAMDQNGDGVISASELRQVLKSMGENINDKDIGDMMKAADMDGDGKINYVEFIQMMKNR
ncbi:calmodulin-like [Mizuhopecten yessoensis]|uniref:Calmodulin n=1 Tax=Mizuhopecten yessoensis TaxID=6573 RepID=A0A210R5X8_MIZYE|nr:calmodulin-like [Mizuhopecten yessoensis]OWF56432.1 Calmodulin [Mizuhopecten yessoensis]